MTEYRRDRTGINEIVLPKRLAFELLNQYQIIIENSIRILHIITIKPPLKINQFTLNF